MSLKQTSEYAHQSLCYLSGTHLIGFHIDIKTNITKSLIAFKKKKEDWASNKTYLYKGKISKRTC